MIRRREFITLLGGAAAWPLAARAQQGDHVRRIGVLMSLDGNDPEMNLRYSAFTQALANLGWTDGRNVRIDLRWGGGDINRIRALAQELVGSQPEIIETASNKRWLCRFMAPQFLRCGAAKSDTLAAIADMPPARRGLRSPGL